MSKLTIENKTLKDIANAIRSKGSTTELLTPVQMPDAIRAIEGGGGSDIPKVRTPEEVYAAERPLDWPVLPEPTQENEFYFLCGRNAKETSVAKPATGASTSCLMEWGYIDDDGSFVPVYTLANESLSGTSWTSLGLGTKYWNEEKMSKYYVLHTVGADTSYDAATSSNVSSTWMRFVLEIKARCSNPSFRSGKSSGTYPGFFRSCEFIKLYGPQNWTVAAGKFGRMYALKALLFDSEENNPFLHDLTSLTDTSAAYIFYYCSSLTCYYPLTNWSKIINLTSAYNSCYSLAPDYISFETDKKYTFGSSVFLHPIRASIKVPKQDTGGVFSSSAKYFDDLDVSGYTASGHSSYLSRMTIGSIEINNLKVGPVSLTGSNVLYDTISESGSAFRYLQKVTMSPEQTGDNMPTSWTIAFPSMSYTNLKLFLNSLPTVTKGNKLTIYHTAYCREVPQELIDIAVGKGYTISFSAA